MGGDYLPLSYGVGYGCLWSGVGSWKVGFQRLFIEFSVGEAMMERKWNGTRVENGRTHTGRTLDAHWTNAGCTLDSRWMHTGLTLDAHWTNAGCTLDSHWTQGEVKMVNLPP